MWTLEALDVLASWARMTFKPKVTRNLGEAELWIMWTELWRLELFSILISMWHQNPTLNRNKPAQVGNDGGPTVQVRRWRRRPEDKATLSPGCPSILWSVFLC